ncbi:hypothetical protein [Sphingobacterium multivorum]|uniref:hypothetical protein n=1 Tax=Sphingobacterium multivorum TaxID=28454 RepID=UPI0028AD200A|nr:hypothetical protein [Sphingobacterium multivorum]
MIIEMTSGLYPIHRIPRLKVYLPSTFKVINMLIALETSPVKDENAVVKWP